MLSAISECKVVHILLISENIATLNQRHNATIHFIIYVQLTFIIFNIIIFRSMPFRQEECFFKLQNYYLD